MATRQNHTIFSLSYQALPCVIHECSFIKEQLPAKQYYRFPGELILVEATYKIDIICRCLAILRQVQTLSLSVNPLHVAAQWNLDSNTTLCDFTTVRRCLL